MKNNQDNNLDSGMLLGGFIIGLIVGGIAALFRTPRSGNDVRQQLVESGDNLRGKIESVIVSDPVAESMAEGKAAARRRRIELGFND
ncbi:MAG: YtxH domain-containing protein [Anaerolineae bacterium]|nr:YtxH domain-containing protein [Anaerolineae bacterium]